MGAAIHNDLEKIVPLNVPIKIGNISTTLLVDYGSACTIWNQSLETRVVNSNLHEILARETFKPQLRTFSNELIQIEEKSNSRN